ncbi:Trm112 family protein [Allonocardiopsis opalescens]|uniref:UPF0434 protein CLV72_10180 n=1 Tax=Allonocardiopsis opalescens TaxID=1144618 RepID=A0A2T0QC72_9ACTN|nr:Trm112 family protein [Allonocardiopsis opalescens]PRY01498.1 hypothetical protein CLV72_10180 [Allonocardiopsis opalescens]
MSVKIESWLLDILACPQCKSPIRLDERELDGAADGGEPATAAELVCTDPACGLAYPIRDGIPVLLVDEARRPGTGAAAR